MQLRNLEIMDCEIDNKNEIDDYSNREKHFLQYQICIVQII